ncbi:MAG: hypothetical protein AB1646_06285 [Thermodesulfobacteriota bacterium]
MKVEKTDQAVDVACVPGEFRENYRFLRELIDRRALNNTAEESLRNLAERRLLQPRNGLNRRQTKLMKDLVKGMAVDDAEWLEPPVPVELEAAIRIKKKSTWLPWESEAIRKIELWRTDVAHINRYIAASHAASVSEPIPIPCADRSN